MDLKELLNRKSQAEYTTEEACFMVEKYILQETGENVKIDIFKNIKSINIDHPIAKMILTRQLQMLNHAFVVASQKLKI